MSEHIAFMSEHIALTLQDVERLEALSASWGAGDTRFYCPWAVDAAVPRVLRRETAPGYGVDSAVGFLDHAERARLAVAAVNALPELLACWRQVHRKGQRP